MKRKIDIIKVEEMLRRHSVPMVFVDKGSYYVGVYKGENLIFEKFIIFKVTINSDMLELFLIIDEITINFGKKLKIKKNFDKSINVFHRPDGRMVFELIKKHRNSIERIEKLVMLLLSPEVGLYHEHERMSAILSPRAMKNQW